MVHTPGPWKIGNCDPSIIWAGRYGVTKWQSNPGDELGECVVVAVAIRRPLDLDAEAWDRETKANARLIAAAPDLLTVARMVVDTATIETPPELLRAAEAALAMAEGKEG